MHGPIPLKPHILTGAILFAARSVGDPDPQCPHVFGPSRSGPISQRYGPDPAPDPDPSLFS